MTLFCCVVFFHKDGRYLNEREEQEVLKGDFSKNTKKNQESEDNKKLLLMLLRIMVAGDAIAK